MFGIFFNCVFLSFTLLTSACYHKLETTPKKVVEWLTPTEHDFGTIKHDQPVSFVFEFKNIAAEAIVLQTVRTTCGCTAASWTESPIQPGEKGEVRIEYDAYKWGDFRKKITVFFDKQRKADILKISGSVE